MKLALVATLALAISAAANAAPITYSVNETAGSQTAKGTITTNGSFGYIYMPSQILGYTFTVSNGSTSNTYTYQNGSTTAGNGSLFLAGADLLANSSALFFNFGGTDGGGVAFADTTASNFLCFVSSGNVCATGLNGNIVIGVNQNFVGTTVANTIQVVGTVVPNAAVTPEPSSLILLGTGALGAFAAMRRRVLSR